MGRPDTGAWLEIRFGLDGMIGPGLATGPDTKDLADKPDIGDGLEAHLGVENDGPGSLVGPGIWGELADRPRLS